MMGNIITCCMILNNMIVVNEYEAWDMIRTIYLWI
jgi:hypothetical protein